MSARQTNRDFHLFPQLPPEIRDFIWSLCLPHRVAELDDPQHDCIYRHTEPSQCLLSQTSRRNNLPPLISRVCHESRAVAIKARAYMAPPAEGEPYELSRYFQSSFRGSAWIDSNRDTPHLNWTLRYDRDPMASRCVTLPSEGTYLNRLALEAARSSGQASLMRSYFGNGSYKGSYPGVYYRPLDGRRPSFRFRRPSDPAMTRDRDALLRLASCQVVMCTVIIHLDLKPAIATGLFGLLGEEVVKIIDVDDEQTCDEYYRLAEHCNEQNSADSTVPQVISRSPSEKMKQALEDEVMVAFDSKYLVEIMRPVIMFRLCTSQCHARDVTKDDNWPFWKDWRDGPQDPNDDHHHWEDNRAWIHSARIAYSRGL